MNNRIFLEKAPTTQDYFKAKLLDEPLVIFHKSDILKYKLIDDKCKNPFKYNSTLNNRIFLSNMTYRNDIEVSILKMDYLDTIIEIEVRYDDICKWHPELLEHLK